MQGVGRARGMKAGDMARWTLWVSLAFCGQLKQAADTVFKTHDHTYTSFAFVNEDVVHETGVADDWYGVK